MKFSLQGPQRAGSVPPAALPSITTSGDLRFQLDPAVATIVSGGAQSIVDRSAYGAGSNGNVWTATSSGQRPTAGTDSVGAYVQMVPASHSEMKCTTGGLQSATENHGLIALVTMASGQASVADFGGFGDPAQTKESGIGNYGTEYYGETMGNTGSVQSAATIDGALHVLECYQIGGNGQLWLDGQLMPAGGLTGATQNVVKGSGLFDRAGHNTPSDCKLYQMFGIAGPSVITAAGKIVLGPNGTRWEVLSYLAGRFSQVKQAGQVIFRGHSQINGGNLTGGDLLTETVSAHFKSWVLSDHGKSCTVIKDGAPGWRTDQIYTDDQTTVFPQISPLAPIRCAVIWEWINDAGQLVASNPPDYTLQDQCVNRVIAQVQSQIAGLRLAGINGPIVLVTEPDATNYYGVSNPTGARNRINTWAKSQAGKNGILVYDLDAALFALEPVPGVHTQWRDDGLHLTKDNMYVSGQGGFSLVARGVSDILYPYLP